MSLWKAQSVQAVWFLDQQPQNDIGALFQEITGVKPEVLQSSRVLAPTPTNVGVAQGNDAAHAYTLQLNPGRLDLFLAPFSGEPIKLGDAGEQIGIVRDRVSVQRDLGSAGRLAFIVNLLQVMPELTQANALMREQIDVGFPLDEDQDFNLRLNRRTRLGEHLCNRICTWSVGQAQHQVVELTISLQQHTSGMPIQLDPSAIAASQASPMQFGAFAHIDVNTVPDAAAAPFRSEDQPTIFAALADEALRLCRENRYKALS